MNGLAYFVTLRQRKKIVYNVVTSSYLTQRSGEKTEPCHHSQHSQGSNPQRRGHKDWSVDVDDTIVIANVDAVSAVVDGLPRVNDALFCGDADANDDDDCDVVFGDLDVDDDVVVRNDDNVQVEDWRPRPLHQPGVNVVKLSSLVLWQNKLACLISQV